MRRILTFAPRVPHEGTHSSRKCGGPNVMPLCNSELDHDIYAGIRRHCDHGGAHTWYVSTVDILMTGSTSPGVCFLPGTLRVLKGRGLHLDIHRIFVHHLLLLLGASHHKCDSSTTEYRTTISSSGSGFPHPVTFTRLCVGFRAHQLMFGFGL